MGITYIIGGVPVYGRVDPGASGRDNKISMLRILMVLEDYGELMFLQTVLKKIGFDVDAIQNPRQLQDSMLAMNPDMLVMTANGKKIKGVELKQSVNRIRGLPHIVLIRSHGTIEREAEQGVDAWLDSPVGAMNLLNVIGDLAGLNKEVLADKFVKLRLQEPSADPTRVLRSDGQPGEASEMGKADAPSGNFSTLNSSTISPQERKLRYMKFLTAEVPIQEGFSAKQVKDQVKDLRAQENPESLADLERERREFVNHLFRKKG